MEALLIALIIGLGGSFLTALTVNSMGARLESRVQNLSHKWMQWPQRLAIYTGITVFSAAGLNYYLHQTYQKDLFYFLENIPLLRELAAPLRWFLHEIGVEVQAFYEFLPMNMPLLTTLLVLLVAMIMLSSFGFRGLQKWLFMGAIGFLMVVLLQDGFKKAAATSADKAEYNYELRQRRIDDIQRQNLFTPSPIQSPTDSPNRPSAFPRP